MAITVGFIRAIGVRTGETFTPDISAVLEEDFGITSKLEEKYSLMAKLEENFSIKTILEKGLTILAKLEEKFNIKGRIKK